MKRLVFITLVISSLLLVQQIQAGVSVIMNGSFENNGHEITDIKYIEAPKRWCDVNIPDANKFGGYVGVDWKAEGSYSLTLGVKKVATDKEDIATISQKVYLEQDANVINFNVKLTSSLAIFYPWELQKRSAVIKIDDDIIWDSNTLPDLGVNGDGEFLNRSVSIEGLYSEGLYDLSLGIKINENISNPDASYHAKFDFIRFNAHCGGFGYLPEDLNRDCNVDSRDFALLAGQWLLENPDQRYDLVWIDKVIIDGLDLGAFTEYWLARSDANGWAGDVNFPPGLLEADLNDDGIVDFRDFTILSADWKNPADCTRADIDCSKMVDNKDLKIMADEWLMKSWLYGL